MNIEQRALIKVQAKLGTSATKTHEMLRNLYGDECLSKTTVSLWHKRFKCGRERLEDDGREGYQRTKRTPENIEQVRAFIEHNSSASTRMIADELSMNKETVRTILREDLQLGKRKV